MINTVNNVNSASDVWFVLGCIVGVALTWAIAAIVVNWYTPRKTEWVFFREYKSYTKRFYRYLLLTLRSNIEPRLFKSIVDGRSIVYGGFLIEHNKYDTNIRNMVFLRDLPYITDKDKDVLNIFKQIVGKVESIIYMKHPHTTIRFVIPIERSELIIALTSLGYKQERVFYSNFEVELVKTKSMN